VHLDDLLRAGPLVERVDVLCDDGCHEAAPLELGERQVRGVRARVREGAQAAGVEVPDRLRVAEERVDRRHLHRVVLGPDAGRRAEVGDPAFRADPGPGEDDARLPLTNEVGELLGVRHGLTV
jgi:hypothetical protein